MQVQLTAKLGWPALKLFIVSYLKITKADTNGVVSKQRTSVFFLLSLLKLKKVIHTKTVFAYLHKKLDN